MAKKELEIKAEKNLDNRTVIIGNEIIKTRYKLSLPTQKLLLFLISHISYEERKEGKFLHTLLFPLPVIFDFLKKTGRESDKNLKGLLNNSIEELKIKSVDFKYLCDSKSEETSFPWYSEISIKTDEKQFKFSFNDKMAKVLLTLKGYFKSYLKEYIYLRSTHAINLYMFFRAHEHLKDIQKRVSLKELKTYLQVDKSKAYERWDLFKKHLLDKSIDQLNQNTSYIFTYTLERIEKNIGFINFTLLDKTDQNRISAGLHKRIESYLLKKKIYKTSHEFFEEVKFAYDETKNFLFVLLPFKHCENVSNLELREYRFEERKHDNLHKKLKEILKKYDFQKKVFFDFFRKKVEVEFFKYDSTKKKLPPLEFLHEALEKSKKPFVSS